MRSEDVKDEYEAGEYVAAAHAAIHDVGVLRTDIPAGLLHNIETLIVQIETEDDAFKWTYCGLGIFYGGRTQFAPNNAISLDAKI